MAEICDSRLHMLPPPSARVDMDQLSDPFYIVMWLVEDLVDQRYVLNP